ncbi:hypothetical protein K491DRAFT_712185 [Lophiostoma macrostomum CBS 122681]|uniref:Rhodopsin domain-containing protein n=1 Tax=Lophiostoma macrostomum CBS 122681 TaxID=1314788 RepID=A0A6A6TLU0_9PLEO|nr:hypothetical protein K491DRAFT_712185 [Lophiostoma macrostomum CBS 122681]
MEGRRNEVLAVAILFFLLTWLTVSLRIYVRAFMLKSWGQDDSYMLATLLTFTTYLAFQITAAIYGTGRHRWELDDNDAKTALLFWYLCEILYVFSNCLLKIALAIFYLRVALQRWHIWVIKLLMAGTVFFGGCYFIMVISQCIPVSEFWNVHPASEKCIPKSATLGLTYALAAINAFADWTFGTLPFLIVWDLQMSVKTKIMVAGILAFAAIGSTGTIVRMKYVHSLTNGPDFLYATTDVALWSTVEPGIGITAGSIATLRPLLQSMLRRIGLTSTPASGPPRISNWSSQSGQKRKYRQKYRDLSLDDLVPTQEGTTATTVSGPQRPSKIWARTSTTDDAIEDAVQPIAPEFRVMSKSVAVEQAVEGPPTLPRFRDSLRNSLGIFNGQRHG